EALLAKYPNAPHPPPDDSEDYFPAQNAFMRLQEREWPRVSEMLDDDFVKWAADPTVTVPPMHKWLDCCEASLQTARRAEAVPPEQPAKHTPSVEAEVAAEAAAHARHMQSRNGTHRGGANHA